MASKVDWAAAEGAGEQLAAPYTPAAPVGGIVGSDSGWDRAAARAPIRQRSAIRALPAPAGSKQGSLEPPPAAAAAAGPPASIRLPPSASVRQPSAPEEVPTPRECELGCVAPGPPQAGSGSEGTGGAGSGAAPHGGVQRDASKDAVQAGRPEGSMPLTPGSPRGNGKTNSGGVQQQAGTSAEGAERASSGQTHSPQPTAPPDHAPEAAALVQMLAAQLCSDPRMASQLWLALQQVVGSAPPAGPQPGAAPAPAPWLALQQAAAAACQQQPGQQAGSKRKRGHWASLQELHTSAAEQPVVVRRPAAAGAAAPRSGGLPPPGPSGTTGGAGEQQAQHLPEELAQAYRAYEQLYDLKAQLRQRSGSGQRMDPQLPAPIFEALAQRIVALEPDCSTEGVQ